MSAGVFTIDLDKGALYVAHCIYKEADTEVGGVITPGARIPLTGMALRGSIKAKSTEETELASIFLNITDDLEGEYDLIIYPSESLKLPAKGKSYADKTIYYYDVELYDPLDLENVTRLLNGQVIVSPEQTTKEN